MTNSNIKCASCGTALPVSSKRRLNLKTGLWEPVCERHYLWVGALPKEPTKKNIIGDELHAD